MKEWFKARNIWYGAFAALTDAEAGRLAKALFAYTATGEEVELSGNERGCLAMIKFTLQMDDTESNCLSEKRREAGLKGAQQKVANQANANFAIAEEANEAIAYNKNKNKNIEKESTLKSTKEKPLARFTPPTVDEVAQYCSERHNGVNPQTFVDFYSAKGWKVGQNPMKDWKACVRTWEQRDEQRGNPVQKPKLVRAQMYDQRDYNEREMEDKLGVRDLFKEDAS